MRSWTNFANASRWWASLVRARRLAEKQRHCRLVLPAQRVRHEAPWLAAGSVAAGLVLANYSAPSRCESQNPRLYPKDLEQFLWQPRNSTPRPAAILVQYQPGGVHSFLLSAHNLSLRRVLAIVFKKFCQAKSASVPGFHIPMKVIVNVRYCGAKAKVTTATGVKSVDGHRLSLAVKPSDTVLRLKQRVMLVEPVSFPEQVLLRDGAALHDSQRLQELGLKEGEELHFNVTATIAAFTQQLVDLLEALGLGIPA
eukprot:s1541_g27.t1